MLGPVPGQGPGRFRWTVRDLLVAAHVAMVYGLLFLMWNLVFVALRPWLKIGFAFVGWAPLASESLMGFWFGAGVLVPYVVRRPGAAFLGEVVAALVQVAATPWGLLTTLSGLVQGAMSELAFAATGYRVWKMPVFVLAGMLPALSSFLLEYHWYDYGRYPLSVRIAMLLVRVGSGALLGGWVPLSIGKRLRSAPVLMWRST